MSELLNLMTVPFQQDRSVLLPKELIEYVLPYAPPLPSSYSHQALIGSLIYKNEKVPVLDVSVLYDGKPKPLSEIDGKRRIVIVSRLNKTDDDEFSSYALLSAKAPSLVEISKADLHDTEDDVPALFYSRVDWVQQNNAQSLFVLDLPNIEKELFN